MTGLAALVAGFVLDQLLGDPPGWPHPVRWLGRLIAALEPPLRRLFPERLAGVVLLLTVAGTAGGAAWGLLALAGQIHPWARVAVAALLTYWGLAARSLARETRAVLEPCRKGDWAEARRRLARIVGRDTQELPPEEVYRACIETVAENTTDAVVAPLLYAALFGPVGLWAFKAISTLDSMVGYRYERYRRFGWASARADDLANLLPARLTYLLIALAALLTRHDARGALRVGWRDRRKHPSPNSAWAEATVAGALRVQLGGPAAYQGTPSTKPRLGDPVEPLTAGKVDQAVRLMLVAAWLALVVLSGPVWWLSENGSGLATSDTTSGRLRTWNWTGRAPVPCSRRGNDRRQPPSGQGGSARHHPGRVAPARGIDPAPSRRRGTMARRTSPTARCTSIPHGARRARSPVRSKHGIRPSIRGPAESGGRSTWHDPTGRWRRSLVSARPATPADSDRTAKRRSPPRPPCPRA